MMDDPEVTIEPADNGYIVRHYQRSTKKDEGGRTIRRVASTAEEALGHAGKVLGHAGKVLGSKTGKKKSIRGDGAPSEGAIGEHAQHSSASHHRSGVRRRRFRSGGRR